MTDLLSTRVIGIHGRARSGKDTIGKYILSQTDGSRYSFAGPLKDTVCEMFGWGPSHRDGDLKEETILSHTTYEQILDAINRRFEHYVTDEFTLDHMVQMWIEIMVGYDCIADGEPKNTTGGLHIDCRMSPRKAFQLFGTEWGRAIDTDMWLNMAKKASEEGQIVVTDVRFQNEADWVRDNGILIIVNREDAVAVNSHASEAGIEPLDSDIIIDNNGTLKKLYNKVDKALKGDQQ